MEQFITPYYRLCLTWHALRAFGWATHNLLHAALTNCPQNPAKFGASVWSLVYWASRWTS